MYGSGEANLITKHNEKTWKKKASYFIFDKGPVQEMYANFRVLEFEPDPERSMWTYATSWMSSSDDVTPVELHMFSNRRDRSLIELLTAVAYYHKNTSNLRLNDFVNLGRPWQDASNCEFGFISLPYLDGPDLEVMRVGGKETRFYWLIPVTAQEKRFAMQNGVGTLEDEFDKGFNYADPNRRSVV